MGTTAPDAVLAAVGHLNVCWRDLVAPASFLAALAGAHDAAGIQALAAFLDEADPADFAELVASAATVVAGWRGRRGDTCQPFTQTPSS